MIDKNDKKSEINFDEIVVTVPEEKQDKIDDNCKLIIYFHNFKNFR